MYPVRTNCMTLTREGRMYPLSKISISNRHPTLGYDSRKSTANGGVESVRLFDLSPLLESSL